MAQTMECTAFQAVLYFHSDFKSGEKTPFQTGI